MRSSLSPERNRRLRTLEVFKGCTDKELAIVNSLTTEIEAPPGEVLIDEGTPGSESFVIVSGDATVSAHGHEVARLGPGDFFGEMAVLASRPRSATVTATTPMMVLVLDRGQLFRLLDIGWCARVIARSLVERLAAAMDRPAVPA
jgi:CRP-like cAMP-binding protein